MDIASFFWFVLSIFTIGLLLSLFYLFLKDRDLRKIMFALGLLPSVFTFLYLGLKFPPAIQPENTLPFFIYRWGTIPIIESYFFILVDRIWYRKKDFISPFFIFLFFYIFSFILVVLNTVPEDIFYSSIQFSTLLIIILCIVMIVKERKFSGWLFLLSISCFTVARISLSIYIRQTENVSNTILTLFSFFLAYIFLALIFGLSILLKENEGLGVYFSLENKLKKVEAALYDSEQKYRQVVENLNEGIWVLDNNASTTYVNSYIVHLLGYTTNEMTGKNLFEFMDYNGKKIAEEKLKYVINNVEKEYEFEFLRKDKTRILTSMHMSPLFDIGGKSIGTLVGVQDISYRKRMESELHDKLDKLQKGELATLNIMEDLQNTIGALTIAETQIREKNQELQKINSELTSAREELIFLNRDLEKKVKERTADVEKLLKQKDDFISQLGHDLKTPLTPLNILLPIIKEREQDPQLKEHLEVIFRNVHYMKYLIIETLALAQLNSPNMQLSLQDVDLSIQIRDILNTQRTLFEGKNIVFENNIPTETIVQVDLLQIRELFDNLISNAIKYSQEGEVKITFDAKEMDDFIVVSVKDTGVGLEPDQITHVFEEFYKVDNSRHDLESTGLGLTICQRIVEKHGGRIWVESQGKGKGTTFFFTLKPHKRTSDKKTSYANTNEVRINTVL
jgi:PAS domain S-box-containing protein